MLAVSFLFMSILVYQVAIHQPFERELFSGYRQSAGYQSLFRVTCQKLSYIQFIEPVEMNKPGPNLSLG